MIFCTYYLYFGLYVCSVFSAISCFCFLLSLSLSLLLSRSLVLLGFILFVPQVNKLISLLLPRLLLALVVFSCSLFHSRALCVSVFFFPPPAFLSASSSSPLGFSPVERLSSEGNDRVTAFDAALVMEAWHKLITCVWEIEFLLRTSMHGCGMRVKIDGGFLWRCVEASCMNVGKEECVLCSKTWCCNFFPFYLDFLYVKECSNIYFFYQQSNISFLTMRIHSTHCVPHTLNL